MFVFGVFFMQKAAIYSRKSKFTGKGESIENQIELCRRYIEMSDKEMQIIIYEDEGFSGGNLERPQFKRMMKDAREGKLSRIIVYRLDRISRNIGDFAGLIEELNRLGVEFVSIREQFDTSSPLGRAMMYIASIFSQLERETIAERIRDNMLELSKTGRWLGGVTPTGYTSESVSTVTLDGRTKKSCKLKLVEEEAMVVKEIFDQYLQNESLKETAEIMNQKGFCTRKGRQFTPVAVRAILCNPVYAEAGEAVQTYFTDLGVKVYFSSMENSQNRNISDCVDFAERKVGILAYNRTLQRPGKTNQCRNANDWIIAIGKHEPIISGTDWVKTQKILKRNGEKCKSKERILYE